MALEDTYQCFLIYIHTDPLAETVRYHRIGLYQSGLFGPAEQYTTTNLPLEMFRLEMVILLNCHDCRGLKAYPTLVLPIPFSDFLNRLQEIPQQKLDQELITTSWNSLSHRGVLLFPVPNYAIDLTGRSAVLTEKNVEEIMTWPTYFAGVISKPVRTVSTSVFATLRRCQKQVHAVPPLMLGSFTKDEIIQLAARHGAFTPAEILKFVKDNFCSKYLQLF